MTVVGRHGENINKNMSLFKNSKYFLSATDSILTHERSEALIVLGVAEFVHQALGLLLGKFLT